MCKLLVFHVEISWFDIFFLVKMRETSLILLFYAAFSFSTIRMYAKSKKTEENSLIFGFELNQKFIKF